MKIFKNHSVPHYVNLINQRSKMSQVDQVNATETEVVTILHEKNEIKKYKKGEIKPELHVGSSYISISNPSLRDGVVVQEEADDSSLRARFNYNEMNETFTQYQILADELGVDILPETLEFMNAVFILLTENDNEVAEKLYDNIVMVDDTYPVRFVQFAHINNPNSGFLTTVKSKARDHLVRQLKKILECHRIMITALMTDKEYADHLMHLLGLSHYLMRVAVADFDLLAISCIKLLLDINVCNEETVIHAVAYFCTITKSVRKTIDGYYRGREKYALDADLKNQTLKSQPKVASDDTDISLEENNLRLILSKGGIMNLWARQNYRSMKDWAIIQEEVRRNVYTRNPLAAETHLYVTERVQREISSVDNNIFRVFHRRSENILDKRKEKCLLTWLKKGYKFKKDDNNVVYQKHEY